MTKKQRYKRITKTYIRRYGLKKGYWVFEEHASTWHCFQAEDFPKAIQFPLNSFIAEVNEDNDITIYLPGEHE